eukprot:1158263-Pelagomonas_calceolata.AAC.12
MKEETHWRKRVVSPLHHKAKKSADWDLESHWKHPVPEPDCEKLDFVCWTDALNWRGTAGFLLQGLGELTHTRGLLYQGLD